MTQTDSENDPQRQERPVDDRRSKVDPSKSPVPSSPEADEDAVRKGEDVMERIKPY